MSVLRGKKILLGITGGIAAYKTPILVRLLKKTGAEIKVILTENAKEFVTPLSLSTVSENPVLSKFKDDDENWNNHVELGLWCDFMIICPATANSLYKMANGNCDNLLIATYLSCKSKIFFAPAMDLDMYKHESTKQSIEKLISFGNILIPPDSGELASGLVGEGRLPEPRSIVDFLIAHYSKNLPLKNKKVLITAGPTLEPIDPVRFISNHSSGKMGYRLAEEAERLGASVCLISGPSNETLTETSIDLVNVRTSDQMEKEVMNRYQNSDIVIMAAAISDYTPKSYSNKKIKKESESKVFTIDFKKTNDILYNLGKLKKNQLLIGFALENNNEIKNAKKKLKEKNLDIIVLNSLNDEGAAFGHDTNKVTIIDDNLKVNHYDLKPKRFVANDIFEYILSNKL
ncbi:MAG: bifunctional phosphopantothenoylcysteine decarboxylase/phosphopantothenate--cysteine ligase CoaBC [Flavobacteriaceae bacterium]|tara:strand:- start:381 stop:1586 length:1206 start_codon:yes stop_codon:yes gene_type:complete